MDFKETYKKYLEGTATDEEKTFVESEIEKAKLVNHEIIANAKPDEPTQAPGKKEKSKKSLRHTLKTIIISVVVFMVISLIAFAVVYNLSISNAIDNIEVSPEEARQIAIEEAFSEMKYHRGYTGTVDALDIMQSPGKREMVFGIPLDRCHYVYEFEFIADDYEIEVQVNSSTGMCNITDIDKLD